MRWNYYKLRQLSLLQSAKRFITNCDRHYKVQWIYYKLRQVLQSAMIITNCGGKHAMNYLASDAGTQEAEVTKSLAVPSLIQDLPFLIQLSRDFHQQTCQHLSSAHHSLKHTVLTFIH